MEQVPTRKFDLEERSLRFADNVRTFVKSLPYSELLAEDRKQLVRASGAIGANYIEANQSIGNRDFVMRARIARKEAKESHYWLQLMDIGSNAELEKQKQALTKEADELTRIFSAIVRNFQIKQEAGAIKM